MVASRVRGPARAVFPYTFDFFHKSSNTGFYFQTEKKEEVFNNFKIRNYLIFHLITVVVLLITGLMDSCCN